MAIDRECRVIGYRVLKTQSAEPAISQVQLDLFAQLPLGADSVAITDDKHPDHQLRINRWPPELAVERPKLAAKIRQYVRHCLIDPAQQMARWNPPLEIEQVNELALIARLSPHHAESSMLVPSQHRIILSWALPAGFFNGIGPCAK